MDSFSERLDVAIVQYQARIGRRNMTQEELGQALGANQSTVGKWLRGVLPSVDTVERIAKVLGCDPGWLLFGSASAAPPPFGVVSDALAATDRADATVTRASAAPKRRQPKQASVPVKPARPSAPRRKASGDE